jgi:hypothetical protein
MSSTVDVTVWTLLKRLWRFLPSKLSQNKCLVFGIEKEYLFYSNCHSILTLFDAIRSNTSRPKSVTRTTSVRRRNSTSNLFWINKSWKETCLNVDDIYFVFRSGSAPCLYPSHPLYKLQLASSIVIQEAVETSKEGEGYKCCIQMAHLYTWILFLFYR